jgi:DNA repair protein RecN (Recombination protein N)
MLRSLRIENFVLIREAELVFGPHLNAVTGETGAGKTILAQAIGLLLGAPGDAGYLGPGATEAYVEADFDVPEGILAEEELATVAELRPEGETGLVAARRVFADGRTRAYAWGRAVPREDLAALVERLLAMSGQFEQRRLARPSFQLDVLDAFVGDEQLRLRADHARAWRELAAARLQRDELARAEAGRAERVEELRQLVERTEGFAPDTEDALRSERERLRLVTELAEGATDAVEALSSEQSETGAVDQLAKAANALMPVTNLAPELQAEYGALGDLEERV